MNDKHTAYLLLGSNLGNRHALLDTAIAQVAQQIGIVLATSHRYETAAWGYTAQAPFLNQAITIETMLEPKFLLDAIHHIENSMGRVRSVVWGARVIDIDILGYGDQVIDTDRLVIPHSRLHLRRFALLPLHDIAKQWIHPVLQQSVAQLLAICKDDLPCKRL